MELTTLVSLCVGDTSGDGHNIVHDFYYKTTPDLAKSIYETYAKGCAYFEWTVSDWEECCADYEYNKFPFEMVEKLMLFREMDSDIKAKIPLPELWDYHNLEALKPEEKEGQRISLDGDDYVFFYRLILIAGNRDYLDYFEPFEISCYPIGGYGLYRQ